MIVPNMVFLNGNRLNGSKEIMEYILHRHPKGSFLCDIMVIILYGIQKSPISKYWS